MRTQTMYTNNNGRPEDCMHELHLSAQIIVTDTTGTKVTVPDEQSLVRLISQRHHNGTPIIELHPDHQDDQFFNATQWYVSDQQLTDADSTNPLGRANYQVSYTNWQITATNGRSSPVTYNHPSEVAQNIADQSQTTVVLTSNLPGITTTTFAPADTVDPETPTATETLFEEFIDTLPQQANMQEDTPAKSAEIPHTAQPAVVKPNREPEPESADDDGDAAHQPLEVQSWLNNEQPRTRREARESFLTQKQHDSPATKGWRGVLVNLGLRLRPSAAEQAERDDVHAVSQRWPGPRTIAVVNGKGGAGKTPTTICLSAIFARYGGGGVLAWDNNQFRGTLGWRTEQAGPDHTILDLLPQAQSLLATGAQSADLAYYVHHQTEDRYDVLRSKPRSLADQQRFDQADVDSIHRVTSKFFRIIIIDSGNDESDPMWRRMIDHTDQLVVATTTSGERSEAAALLLEDLESTGTAGQKLADESVVVVSQAEATAKKSDMVDVVRRFKPLAREVAAIPYDPAMVDGPLSYSALRPDTQRAWLAAGAAVARGL